MRTLIVLLSTAVLCNACATAPRPLERREETAPTAEDAEPLPALAPWDAEDENVVLRRMLLKLQQERAEERARAEGASEPVIIDPEPVVYPPMLAKTARTADGCENGPGGIEIKNTTDLHLLLKIDGEDVLLLGPKNAQVTLAPRRSAFLCLDPGKDHLLEGTAFVPFAGSLHEAECFTKALAKDGVKDGAVLTVDYRLVTGD